MGCDGASVIYSTLGGGGQRAVHYLRAHGAPAARRYLGEGLQVDTMKVNLKPPGTERLKLKCDILLSTSAFKFNLRHYTWVLDTETWYWRQGLADYARHVIGCSSTQETRV